MATIPPYRHRLDGPHPEALPVGKVVCVGRNYADHARELNNPLPPEPLLFLKPASALVPLEETFAIPTGRGPVHHELEIALLIGRAGAGISAIAGVGLALDLTLRERQDQLKRAGQPWDIAKSFAGACPCSAFVSPARLPDLQHLPFRLEVNGASRQAGNSADMLFPLPTLLAAMDYHFGLLPGDLVLTGTPAGVGPLHPGDELVCSLADQLRFATRVSA